ncbi:MAG TPA: ACT domain-containing protein [Methylomirabilota bacterium]|nr:ACT domain-containing protein [Methylomirabilota bacterium]
MSKSTAVPANLSGESPAPTLPGANLPWQQRREQLRAWLQQHPVPKVPLDEVDAHFDSMPAHYWEQVMDGDIAWSLETVHGFFEMIARPNTPATTPFMDWRAEPQSKTTRVMLCTWDRHGLLAKAAAAFSALKLNIRQADVYTRSDNVVLDVFHVSEADGRTAITPQHMEEVTFLLAGALSEPPRFASLWACSRHKFLAQGSQMPPRVVFDNDAAVESTIVRIEAGDRLGLLYDVLQALAELGLNIKQATVQTEKEVAKDAFHVTDESGHKITDDTRLTEIRSRIESSIT